MKSGVFYSLGEWQLGIPKGTHLLFTQLHNHHLGNGSPYVITGTKIIFDIQTGIQWIVMAVLLQIS